ncbi:hypothetical protein ACRALDRAFT_1066330 [Sodiomyces alcalophilus JCM 7366]|uniref:uncharacterized protein n=1 Tax=Sodiomyces alcalophilus JCM 7366 TaxID=591952 RepID=UPI0039B3DBC6
MKTTPFWASIALTNALAVLAQQYPEPPPEVSDCTASLITTLCDYKPPGPNFAVASSGKAHCWEYCNEHQPCDFVIFAAGNPYTGTGTCWLYPGETFDESAGTTGCDFLSVYDKPDCGDAEPTPTPTAGAGACEATASPSAVATVCGYPAPDDDCFYSCSASSSSSNCLSQCVEADSCSYAVFNPNNPSNSPHAPGSCWMYSSGTFDPEKAQTCSGAPEQFVYENPCPKPPTPSSSSSSSPSASSPASSDSAPSPTGSGSPRAAAAQGATSDGDASNDDSNGSAPTGVWLGGPLALGLAVLMWQGL